MLVKYCGTDFLLQGQQFDLAGGSAWTPQRFEALKGMNPKGKLVALTESGEKNLIPIGDLELVPVYKGY